ncbi:DUF4351 domain-containing protein [Acaryochloris marina]
MLKSCHSPFQEQLDALWEALLDFTEPADLVSWLWRVRW